MMDGIPEEDYSPMYLAIIERYKDYIEDRESISVAELPRLISPKSEAVLSKIGEIKQELSPYAYNNDFKEAARRAFYFVKDKVKEVLLPLQFWFTPEETLAFMMGDRMDKGILLCSMLVALGNPSAKVLMRIKGEEKKILVHYEFVEKTFVMDIDDGINEFPSKEKMLEWLSIGEDTIAYEFNNQSYIDIN